VDDVTLSVGEGEIFGILGPNGAGKTTTVECVIGLRSPDSGSIRVMGSDPTVNREHLHAIVGVQLQSSALPAKLRVAEIIELYRSFYRQPADPSELIAALGLAEKRRAYYRSLSGGQKQRLSIALALIGAPQVAVLDEMTTGLDPQARRDMWDMIDGIRDHGVTILLVTHFMEEAERLCDRVIIMDHGKVVADDTLQGLYGLLPVTNLLAVELTGGREGPRLDELLAVKGVQSAKLEAGTLRVGVVDLATETPRVLEWLVERGHLYRHVTSERADLETVFLTLTGRSLRDA
jgi:ABC-2 type transport system ATP-binding protein